MNIQLLGVGSSHGDDRAGWEVVRRLKPQLPPGTAAAMMPDPFELLNHLDGCDRLVVVDACQRGAEPGTILRLTWQDRHWLAECGSSTHGFGVAGVLSLAAALGRLPPDVVLFGIECQAFDPGTEISAPVRTGLPELCRMVLEEIRRPSDGMLPEVAERIG